MTNTHSKRTQIRIPRALIERLETEIAASGLTQSEIIRAALEAWLTQQEQTRRPTPAAAAPAATKKSATP